MLNADNQAIINSNRYVINFLRPFAKLLKLFWSNIQPDFFHLQTPFSSRINHLKSVQNQARQYINFFFKIIIQIINFNPIGYQSRTKNGSEYQKSNIYKTIGLVTSVGIGVILGKKIKQNRPFGLYWSDESFIEIAKAFNKEVQFSDKTKNILRKMDLVVDMLAVFGIGYLLDQHINKKRAEKADDIK